MSLVTRDVLRRYDDLTHPRNNIRKPHPERPLCLLLLANEKKITGLLEENSYRFHKMFRQIDVIDDSPQTHDGSGGYTDSAIWLLLDNAKGFWKLLDTIENEKST